MASTVSRDVDGRRQHKQGVLPNASSASGIPRWSRVPRAHARDLNDQVHPALTSAVYMETDMQTPTYGLPHVKHTSNRPAVVQVTQRDLRRFLELDPLCKEHERLRNKLTDLLAQEATVEPGEYSAFLEIFEQRRFSRTALAQVLPENDLRKVAAQLPLTPSRVIRIQDSVGRKVR